MALSGRTGSAKSLRESGGNSRTVTGVVEREDEVERDDHEYDPECSNREREESPDSPDAATAAARLRDRGERVRRRELDTALGRLEADGELTPSQRAILARLSERVTAALVERWVSTLDAEGIDSEAALELLAE